jgi:acyl transferase domain-containing protein/acyl-CoA synthetase (AMP-forming)/AMP-acid ligase II/acyl carrier protein
MKEKQEQETKLIGKGLDSSMPRKKAIAHGDALASNRDMPQIPALALKKIVELCPDGEFISIQRDGSDVVQSYAQIWERASKMLGGLRKLGLQPGSPVIVHIDFSQNFAPVFWSCFMGGFIPLTVPIAPNYREQNQSMSKLYDAWRILGGAVILTTSKLAPQIYSAFGLYKEKDVSIVTDEILEAHRPDVRLHQNEPEDTGLFLLSSGTTGKPKLVTFSCGTIVSRLLNGKSDLVQPQKNTFLSWLPLAHIGGLKTVLPRPDIHKKIHVPTEFLFENPLRWLDLCEKYGVTHASATSFLLRLVVEKLNEKTELCWDLSSIKHIYMGAEMIGARTADTFLKLLAPQGLRPDVICPSYGLSECGPIAGSDQFVLTATSNDDRFVEIGKPTPGHSIRIVDEDYRLLEEGQVGSIQVIGPTMTSGYYQSPELNQEWFTSDGWLNTGDIGLLKNGRLTITGREKDILSINALNYPSHEIESIVEEVEGVEPSYTAAVATRKPTSDTDELVIFFNTFISDETLLANLLNQIRKNIVRKFGVNPTYFIPIERETIPRTATGKIQKKQLLQRFETSEFDSVLAQIDKLIRKDRHEGFVAPNTSVGQQLADIWIDVLGVERVGIHDNFFELGGHSLLMIRVLKRLQEIIDQDISMITLFQYPTIASLCNYLGGQAIERSSIEKIYDRAERQFDASHQGDIAVVGMSGRFPKANTLDQFWHNLREGLECVSFFSEEELYSSGVNPALIDNPDYVRASGVFDDIELFDASFFNFNPREAEITSPQQRLFLECAWEALENSGCDTEKYDGLIGVYAGSSGGSYMQSNLLPNERLMEKLGGQVAIGNKMDYLSTRVSYKLNLKGPSVNIQTTCSTSLVAVAFACESLRSYQCDTALAGGVSIKIPQKTGYLYQEGGILSPDGHCRAFDAEAQGVLFGDGVGIVILKRLADALAEGDCIRAVIKGSAVNNDGAQKVGYTAPAVDGQADVIAMAQAIARVNPETISYIEAHGTGTPLGDPIELAALTKAFRAGTDRKSFCAIGSVKTNIGHMNAAAGIAGLIKTVLALENKLLPPSLHFKEPNPEIDFENSPFYVNTKLSEWTAGEHPRRAGVSSFGIGGTNAHVIVEEGPPREGSGPSRPQQLLLLSAKTASALETATKNLVGQLKGGPNHNLADVAYTLQVGRREFSHRRVTVCQNVDEAVNAFDIADPKKVFTALADMDDRPVVFMFSGQGSQYVNMGLELYRGEAAFREQIDVCAEILKPLLGLDLRDVLYPDENRIEEAMHRLTQTSMTQPALFSIEYALAKLLAEWGIRPRAMIGHSIGEYVAACIAGVFSLEDALEVVAMRGRLIQELPGGAMLAVALSEKEVRGLIGSQVSLAAVNGGSSCVISGTEKNVAAFQSELAAQKVHCQRLHTSHAFHSEMMEPMLSQFTQFLARINLNPPEMRYISNVTGTWITVAEATDPTYWGRHIRHTVHFADGIAELLKMPDAVLLEIGPGRTLATIAKQQVKKTSDQSVLSSLPHPNEQEPDLVFLLKTVGRLWLNGVKIDWTAFSRDEKRQRISLPTYPFERQRYWIEPQTLATTVKAVTETVGKKPNIADWFYIPSWKRTTSLGIDKFDILNQKKRSWLIFIDEYEVGANTAKRLKEAGQHVVIVTVGEKFTKVDDGFYRINPQTPDDYGEMLRDLSVSNSVPSKILHFWSITPTEHRDLEFELVEGHQYLGFYSLLFLAQGLGKHCVDNSIQILVFSNNMRDVTGGELVCPEKATLSGACKVIPQEYQNLKCRSIDLSIPLSDTKQKDKMITPIIHEALDSSSETVVAYRGDYRWVEAFEPVRLNRTAEITPRLKEKGTYLITGGLGGMGFALAECLSKTLKAKLILTGRSYFPAKEEWEQWLAIHDEKDSTSQKIRKIQELEELGAEFLIVRADIVDLEQMQTVISRAEEEFGKVNGVVHAAGIIDYGGIIQGRSLEETAEVLESKITGTLVLDTVFADAVLDFFVCCSSIVTVRYKSLFGGVGYCAANEFLDAFSYYRLARTGAFTVTINWPGWSEVGMAERSTDYFSEVYGAKIEKPTRVSPSEGVDIFLRVIGGDYPRVAVWNQESGIAIEQEQSLVDMAPRLKTEKPSHSRPDLQTPYAAPSNEQERAVADIWQELLGVQKIGIYDNYFELGGDSLLAVTMISRLRDIFEIEFPLARLFETPTIAGLTELIETLRLKDLGPRSNRENTTSGREDIEI